MSAPALIWTTPPEYQPPLRLVPPDPDEFNFDDPTVRWQRPPTGPTRRLPDPPPPEDVPVWDEPGEVRGLVWRLVCLVLEVFDGRRPVAHLRGIVTPEVFEAIRTRAQYTAGRQHRLRTLHTCRPARDVLELCGTLSATHTKRTRTLALVACRCLVLLFLAGRLAPGRSSPLPDKDGCRALAEEAAGRVDRAGS
jgi:hypothetical protein